MLKRENATLLNRYMGPPKGLLRLIPLPGQKLKSAVDSVASKPVDQPLVEETPIPSPLKTINTDEVLVEDVTLEEVPKAIEVAFEEKADDVPKQVKCSGTKGVDLMGINMMALNLYVWE